MGIAKCLWIEFEFLLKAKWSEGGMEEKSSFYRLTDEEEKGLVYFDLRISSSSSTTVLPSVSSQYCQHFAQTPPPKKKGKKGLYDMEWRFVEICIIYHIVETRWGRAVPSLVSNLT